MKHYVIFAALFYCSPIFATPLYVTEVKTLYQDSTNTKVIGKLLPTTKVEVLKTQNNRVLLSIEGYQEENKPAIYYIAGKRILSAGFDSKANITFKKGEKETIDGKNYYKVKAEFWSENNALDPDLKKIYTQAKNLFEQNCSICHGLHNTKEFSANQWPSMFKSMAGRTGIEKKDYQLVIEYLQKHAKDMQ
ncbi:hypothetical protein LW135_06825 [Helicobacter sp. faydin-H20]|uniref:hypothetical protein n=1 Tax=Helicobacter anatolicus TaxID=2905874 RepID=UPI001E5671E1|nr:hypothetical protein [Helicobacter anatolicus]MCE3037533.1 hypothetical protein [Helicobacter anatolicus]